MSGMFRYAKGIAASLALATVAFAGRYVEHWLFPDVEVLQPETGIVVMDEFARASHSLSPMRAQSDRNSVTWKVAVVTNRSDMSSANVQTINHGQAYRTLSEQVVDVIYATPEHDVWLFKCARANRAPTRLVPAGSRSEGSCPGGHAAITTRIRILHKACSRP